MSKQHHANRMSSEYARGVATIPMSKHHTAAVMIADILKDLGQDPSVDSKSAGSTVTGANLLRLPTLLRIAAFTADLDCDFFVHSVGGKLQIAVTPNRPEAVTLGELEAEGTI